jgi:hypothetical protein
LNCEAFNGLENLQELSLKRNCLEKFDLVKLEEILAKLTSLKKLDITHYNMANFDEIANRLAELNIVAHIDGVKCDNDSEDDDKIDE